MDITEEVRNLKNQYDKKRRDLSEEDIELLDKYVETKISMLENGIKNGSFKIYKGRRY